MRIGIDLGGTKIEGIAIADDGHERLRRRAQTPRGDYDGTLAAVANLVRDIERDVGVQATVGIGIPGAVSPATGVIKNANSTWLIGRPLADDLARMLGRPIRLANDANCFALSEAADGAAAGADVVFGVILGTGTGAGIVVHGKVLTGVNAIGGEWGHNPLPAPKDDERPGPLCYCGRYGCVETFLSGPGLARDYSSTDPRTAEQIAALAAQGEPRALAALERYEERLARALATVVNILDPDVIVLGGGVSNIGRLYESVPRLWTPHVFSDRVATRLVRAKHGDSSGVAAPRGYGRPGRPASRGDGGREAQTPEPEETGTEDTEVTGTERTERTAKPQRNGATEVERSLQQTAPASHLAATSVNDSRFDGSACYAGRLARPDRSKKRAPRIQRCSFFRIDPIAQRRFATPVESLPSQATSHHVRHCGFCAPSTPFVLKNLQRSNTIERLL